MEKKRHYTDLQEVVERLYEEAHDAMAPLDRTNVVVIAVLINVLDALINHLEVAIKVSPGESLEEPKHTN